MEFFEQALRFIFLCPFVLGFIPAVFPLAQLIAALVAGGGAAVGGAAAAGAFGGGSGGGYSPPVDPYTGQVMGIDPNTGLNQRVVDTLWQQPTPEGYEFAGQAADYIDANGLPKWIVNRLEWAKSQNANWFDFFKNNPVFTGALPAELTALLSAPWGSVPSDLAMQSQTQTPQPNESQVVNNPSPQAPEVFPEADYSTTVWGTPQSIPPELAGIGGELLPWMLPGGAPNIVGQPSGGGGLYSNLSPVQNPSGGGMSMNLSPVTPPADPMMPGLGVPVIPSPLPTQLDPYTQEGTPYFYAQGTAYGDPIQPVPSTIGTTLTPTPLPELATIPSGIPNTLPPGAVPDVTIPPVSGATVNTPTPTPQIPIGGGGGGAAIPPGFPVVGGGPLIQTVFGPVPLPQAPPSILDFLRRR